MAIEQAHASLPPARRLLASLIEQRTGWRPDDYALFFVTSEGIPLQGQFADLQEASGYALNRHGAVYCWWLGWDPNTQAPGLTMWEHTQPQARWADSPEYRRAREWVGLRD